MNLMQCVQKIIIILVNKFNIELPTAMSELAQIDIRETFASDLGLDSFDHVELREAVEKEFGIQIPEQDAEKLYSIEDLAYYVEAQLKYLKQ